MGREYKAGEECIPGYRLAKFIGRGGFGEVWRAVGPGGTEVALKIIALDRKQGMKEFRSLRLVKRIHHPNLVPILAFWLIDAEGNPLDDESIDLLGSNIVDSNRQSAASTATVHFNMTRAEQLIIAMGLGEKNLLDVLKEYQAKGLAGIPLEELLDYMEGSARAIDFLNNARHDLGGPQPVAIQHCDIKPQNIMLVGDAVQVCDFGLARSLSDVRSTSVAASIAYGAPELFWENKPTHATDQYSLAITYYELRTGHLPFGPDSAAIEVMQAHRDGKLDLHYLNDAERAVIKRATEPSPSARFERTIDMVRALQRAAHGSAQPFDGQPRVTSVGMRSSFVQAGREIVPGFTLQEHLFHPDARTDVWSASAPGGKAQAVWLYDLANVGGVIDRDALRLMQAVTDHPRLSRLTGWWQLNAAGEELAGDNLRSDSTMLPSTLVIASELTRTNLAHRVEDCRQFRGKGIPVDELIGYMQQVAEGTDALNDATHALRGSRWVSLVHTDLRPANLLVFGNAVKIGNFAWCRVLEGEEAEITGMPVRTARPTMAPELAAGRIHRRSDQYSLAASYVQMRTGNLLLESGLPTGLASGAVAGASLDFSSLSEAEIEVVERAMHSDPNERYPTCRKMVAELALAVKRVPVEVAAPQTAYPVMVPAADTPPFSSQTLAVGDWTPGRQTTTRVSGVLDPSDTKPDVRKTLEEVAVAAKPRRRRLPLISAIVLVLAAGAAGMLTGKQTEADVDRLIDANAYNEAFEATESPPFWRGWRSRPAELRDRVVSSAEKALQEHAQQGQIDAALDILAQLRSKLSGAEHDRFRKHVFSKAIEYANQKIKNDNYADAYTTYERLKEIDSENHAVVELGANLWKSWAELILLNAQSKNFKRAVEIFEQLEPTKDAKVDDVKDRIIEAGIKAIGKGSQPAEINESLDVVQQLNSVEILRDDTKLSKAIGELVSQSVVVAEELLTKGGVDKARSIYERLALLRTDARIRKLGHDIVAAALAPVGDLVATNWRGALKKFIDVADSWPEGDESARDEFERNEGLIVRAAGTEFDEKLETDREKASEIYALLQAPFGQDPKVKVMRSSLDARRGTTPAAPPTAEAVVLGLLDKADANVQYQLFNDAHDNLKNADAKIAAELPNRRDLQDRSALAHAYLALYNHDWKDAQGWLDRVDARDLDGPAQAVARSRYRLLQPLVAARFDGSTLADGADIEAISQAIDELSDADSGWQTSADNKLLVSRVKELCRELAREAAALAGSGDANEQARGQLVLDRIDRQYWPDAGELLVTVNNVVRLLKVPTTPPGEIQKYFDDPKFDRAGVRDRTLSRLADSLSYWGRESRDADALDKSIGWVRSLSQTDDVRRETVGLLTEQVRRAAAMPNVDWKQLAGRCRGVEDSMIASGISDGRSFIQACLAESLIEDGLASSASPSSAAQTEIEAAQKLAVAADDRAYVDYVALRVDLATDRIMLPAQAARITEFCNELKPPRPPVLDTELRRGRAADLLFHLAQGLAISDADDGSLGGVSFSKQDADLAFDWLSRAEELSKVEPADTFQVCLASAALSKTTPDDARASQILDELTKSASPSPAALLMSAKSVEKSDPVQAVRRYAQVLTRLQKPGSAKTEALYDKVVAPGIRVVARLTKEQLAPVASQAAQLYANKGRLIRLDSAVDAKVLEETSTWGPVAVFEAYNKAIELDPGVADYYVQRGTARYKRGSNDLSTLIQSLHRNDIEPANRLLKDKKTPGYYSLTGVANLLEARNTGGPEQRAARIDFHKRAEADERQAVDQCDPQDEDYSQFLLLHSMACLELANYSTDSNEVIRDYLKTAVAAAKKAIELADKATIEGRGSHPELAYRALGNAQEDYGLLLHEYGGYKDALLSFEDARRMDLSSPDEALICLGRCRFRLATSGAEAAKSDQLLNAALGELQVVTNAERLDRERVAEAYWWQSQIHGWRMYNSSDPRKRSEATTAAEKAIGECVQRTDGSSPLWPMYQLFWAQVASKPDDMQSRAREVLDKPSSKADVSERAQALRTIAASYLNSLKPDATSAQRLQQLERGLGEFRRYFSWLPDVTKARVADMPVLVELSEYVRSDRTLWARPGNAELCKACAERALKLADEVGALDVRERARGDLASHEILVAVKQPEGDLPAFRRAADLFKSAIKFDDNLATAHLSATEKQAVRSLAASWRYNLADVCKTLATRGKPEERPTFCALGIQALDGVKDLPAVNKAQFTKLRTELRQIQLAPQARPNQ
jgi:serine/threonine protein kinase